MFSITLHFLAKKGFDLLVVSLENDFKIIFSKKYSLIFVFKQIFLSYVTIHPLPSIEICPERLKKHETFILTQLLHFLNHCYSRVCY